MLAENCLASGQRSFYTSTASVLLLSPDPKGRRGQPLLQRGGVTLLLQTGVRGTMVGVQARVRLGRKKWIKETINAGGRGEGRGVGV